MVTSWWGKKVDVTYRKYEGFWSADSVLSLELVVKLSHSCCMHFYVNIFHNKKGEVKTSQTK